MLAAWKQRVETMHADTLQLLYRGGQCDDHEFFSTVFKFAEQD